MIPYRGPGEAQARQNLHIQRKCGHEAPHLPKELLAIDSCWEMETHFMCVATDRSTMLQSKAVQLRVYGMHELYFMFLKGTQSWVNMEERIGLGELERGQ